MTIDERRRDFKRAVMDVFLHWHKSDTERYDNLTRACIIAGLDPDNNTDRDRLYGAIIACRRGQYEWEMPLINQLVERYIPSRFDNFVAMIVKMFR